MERMNAISPKPETGEPESGLRGNVPRQKPRPSASRSGDSLGSSLEALSVLLDETLERARPKDFSPPKRPFNRNEPAAGSIVISGTGFGIPGSEISGPAEDEDLDPIAGLILAAVMSALKDGGIPLIERSDIREVDEQRPVDWVLPEPLRNETGVIIAPAYPDRDDLLRVQDKYDAFKRIFDQLKALDQAEKSSQGERTEQIRRVVELLRELAADPDDGQDPRLVLEMLAHDHNQIASHIGAQGPVTQLSSGGASASEAISLAEDWVRTGRCRRVILVCITEFLGEKLLQWLGYEKGAAPEPVSSDHGSAESRVKHDHGKVGAYALLLESEDALRERGMRGIAELLGSETLPHIISSNQDLIDHASDGMERLLDGTERRFALYRAEIAPHMVFLTGDARNSHVDPDDAIPGDENSHDQEYAIGIAALKSVFGASADRVVVTTATSVTGRGNGSGLEAAIAVKILESGVVPPAPDGWLEIPALDRFILGNGKNRPPRYLLYLAGLSQSRVALTLLRSIPGDIERISDVSIYHQWVVGISGYGQVFVEARHNMLCLVGQKIPGRSPRPNAWRTGVGPTLLALEAPWEPPQVPPKRIEGRLTKQKDLLQETEPIGPSVTEDIDHDLLAALMLIGDDFDALDVQILMIASEHIGIALEDLDIDQDLKSEMGLGMKEHAELLIDICQVFDVSGYVNFNTGHYPTLAHIITLVRERRPDLLMSTAKEAKGEKTGGPVISGIEVPPGGDLVTAVALKITSDMTGYTVDMLDRSKEMDLDEDLGIDAAEKLEIFRALCQPLSLDVPESEQLGDFPTLSHIIGFVRSRIGDEELRLLTEDQAGPDLHEEAMGLEMVAVSTDIDVQPIEFAISDTIMLIASELTRIPSHQIDIAADMVEDLGLDQRTQAELVSVVFESFGIPHPKEHRPADYPTLGSLILFVRSSRPDLLDPALIPDREIEKIPRVEDAAVESVGDDQALIVESEIMPSGPITFARYIPNPSQLPPLIECYSTGIKLEGKRVVVMSDRGGVGDELSTYLQELGAAVLPLIVTVRGDELELRIRSWLDKGPIDGVYWLAALDVEPALPYMGINAWRELNRQRVKNLHRTMRTLYDSINHPGSFLIAATRMGGMHGLGYSDVTAPLGGSVAGFTKAYRDEHFYDQPSGSRVPLGQDQSSGQDPPLVKVIDFEVDRQPDQVAQSLIAETLADLEAVEVGYMGTERHGVTLVDISSANHEPGSVLNEETVYLVTGAARRLTTEIIIDLAAKGGTFYLLDLVAAPDPDDPKLALFRTDKRALREQLIEEIIAAVPKPTVRMVDKIVKAIEREEALLRVIESVEQRGGTVHYSSLDLLDESAVMGLINEINESHGRIDVLIHAAGLEISRPLPEKDPLQFDMVYDLKADGFYNLLRAMDQISLHTAVVFASMETFNGNHGQSDSSAANELLRKMTGSLTWQRPGTRGIAISLVAQGMAGVTPGRPGRPSISPGSSGLTFVREELTASNYHGEVIYQLTRN
ncbi:MAG TPA: SDR family NAD(P)-dependent oxidoreductase [candidate division Zixibacteria bacterium]|nr:SDR family NAD(P)-dependent oxidoreductase [candidate division Zixibacteria bacterium]